MHKFIFESETACERRIGEWGIFEQQIFVGRINEWQLSPKKGESTNIECLSKGLISEPIGGTVPIL